MAKPTHDEIIRELTKEVAILNERVTTAREEVRELKRMLEEASRKRWTLVAPIVAAVVSSVLTGVVSYLVRKVP